MKANSELVTKEIFGNDRSIIVRPTYLMGPGDYTHRFTYWPMRLNLGGPVMVPGKDSDIFQYIDVRDVAQWTIRLIENQVGDTFNAVGPASTQTMPAFVHGVHAAFSSPIDYIRIPDYEFLKTHGMETLIPWISPLSERVPNQLFTATKKASITDYPSPH